MVSVVIPCYNERYEIISTLDRILEHINNSSLKVDYEILVIDSSTDDTYEILQNSHHTQYKELKLIKSEHQMFPGEARNTGVKMSLFDIIIFVDTGFSFEPLWFERLVTPLLNDRNLDIVWGTTYTSTECDSDRLFAFLIESKANFRKIIPNVAIRKKVFTDGNWFLNDLRAVEDTFFIQQISDKYTEKHVEAVNLYSGHPKTLKNAFLKWKVYSYFSFKAGYRKKALFSILQLAVYLCLMFFKFPLSIFSIVLLHNFRILLKCNFRYKVKLIELPKVFIISLSIDLGRFFGSVWGYLNHTFKFT
mgnify:CR=1 FL=1